MTPNTQAALATTLATLAFALAASVSFQPAAANVVSAPQQSATIPQVPATSAEKSSDSKSGLIEHQQSAHDSQSLLASPADFNEPLVFERVEYDLVDFLKQLGARYELHNKSYPQEPPSASAEQPQQETMFGDDAQASSWQYGIFDRFTRPKTTSTTKPDTPPRAEDYRNFNTDECGLRYYDDYYSGGALASPVGLDTSPSLPSSSVAAGAAAAPPLSLYPEEEQLGLPPSASDAPSKTVTQREKLDNALSNQQSNHTHKQNQMSDEDFYEPSREHNFGLKHDWNKELFGHEEALMHQTTGGHHNKQQQYKGQQQQSINDELNLSARRNWRRQQLGQTLQNFGFNMSDYLSSRNNVATSVRENFMKTFGSKNGKALSQEEQQSAQGGQQQPRLALPVAVDRPPLEKPAVASTYESVDSSKLEARVIGGTDARLGDSPWSVSLQALVSRPGTGTVEYRHYCGGTIISERYVLTAAHCLDFMVGRESRLFVVIGDLQWRMTPSSMYGRRIAIEKLIIHAGYKSTAFGHDIGLIRTKESMRPVKVNGRYVVNRVCLPERNAEHTGDAELVGWGLFSNRNEMADSLQIASVPILPRPLCVDLYKRRTGLIQWIIGIELITDRQICASTFGRGICQGDSGSPLVYNEKLRRFGAAGSGAKPEAGAEVVSQPQIFNEQTRATVIGVVAFGGIRRCSYQSLPGVYMQTSKYMDWILPKII